MKYKIRGVKLETTKSISDYIIDKLSRMDKYFENPDKTEAKVVFVAKGKEHKVEITIPYKSFQLRAEESREDIYSAIDEATDKLQRQFRKYKTKLIDKKRKDEIIDKIEDIFEDEQPDIIVKRKTVFLKPMSEEEAIMQMELLDHSFFIFKNEEDNAVYVLYKRKDGDLGLIKTE
ncbi:MAG: ribosome-associated translation inhibitor RaiA [Bacilli bacterium]